MRRLEVRITVAATSPRAAVDREAIETLLAALRGRPLTLVGPGGRRLRVVECRWDPTPSSASAFLAVVEEEER